MPLSSTGWRRIACLDRRPRDQLEWLAAHGTLRRFEAGEVVSKVGDPNPGALHHLLRPHGHLRESGQWSQEGLRMERGGRDRPSPLLANGRAARKLDRRGSDRSAGHRARVLPRYDPAMPRGHGPPGGRHGRPCPPVHRQRPANREDDLARAPRRRPRARAQQSGLGAGAQRPRAQRPRVRDGSRGARARLHAALGRTARGDRQGAGPV